MNPPSIEPESGRGSLGYRVLNTRVSDVLRGRITGPHRRAIRRAAYVRLVADSSLPDEARALIGEVVERTRLWPGERVEVARELVAHFREGLDAGASVEALVQEFGEVRTAARLIRRAKRRARPRVWRAWHRSRQALAMASAVVLVVYAMLAVRFYSGSPVIARNYVAQINAGVADVPRDERAWPIYVAALERFGELPKELKNTAWSMIGPGDEQWEAALAYNGRSQAGIVLAIEAAQRLRLGLVVTDRIDPLLGDLYRRRTGVGVNDGTPTDPNPPLVSVLVPHLGELRKVTQQLAFDARRAASEGDTTRAVADIGALLGVARHTRQYPQMISRIVGDAIQSAASRAARDILDRHAAAFTDDQLVGLAHLFASAPIRPLSPAEIDAQRMWFDDFVQRAYTDDGHGSGRLTPAGVEAMRKSDPRIVTAAAQPAGPAALAPFETFIAPSRRDVVREYDRLVRASVAEIVVPFWERGPSAVMAELAATSERDRSVYAPRPGRVFVPPIHVTATLIERAAQHVEVTGVAIALELFRRKHDRYPASLDELVPMFLPAIPLDRFDGRPMRYVVIDGSPVVYSVGADLDDDRGREPTEGAGGAGGMGNVSLWPASIGPWMSPDYARRPIPDGDWVLYSPGEGGSQK